MHSSNHTLLPELKPTFITEVGALITTPCYLTYIWQQPLTHRVITEVVTWITTPCYSIYILNTYSNNRGGHGANHTLLLDIAYT